MNGKFKDRSFKIFMLIIMAMFVGTTYSQDDANSWFNKGANATSAQEKITCYLEAIKLNPKFIEAYYNLGYVYKNLDDYVNAEKAFREALLRDPLKLDNETKLRITYELGITLKKLNRLREALEMLQMAKSLAVKSEIRAAVLYELGRIKLSMANFNEALADFNEGLQLNSSKQAQFQTAIENVNGLKEVDNYYNQGVSALDKGQYEDAIRAFTYVINESPNYKDVAQKLSQARGMKDQQFKSVELESVYARGIGYLKNNDWKNAILAFSQVEQQNPNYKDVKVKLEEAKSKLDQSLVEEGYDKLYTDGQAAYKDGNWVKALIAFEKVREWNSSYKNVNRLYNDTQNKLSQDEQGTVKNRYYSQGKTDLTAGNWQSAIISFKQLMRIDPNYKDVQQLLSQAERQLQNDVQLEQYYAEGINHYNNGDWLKAILSFEQIQQINPNYQDVNEKLLAAQENYNKSKLADESPSGSQKQGDPQKSSNKWLMIGAIFSLVVLPVGIAIVAAPGSRAKFFLMQGNYQKAALIYESTLLRKPHKVKLYPSLANIYLIQNRTDETAMKVYQISLQQNVNPQMRAKMLELTNGKSIKTGSADSIVSLEEKLRMELNNLRSSI